LLLLRYIYQDSTKLPEDVYKSSGLTRATFYQYAKILDNHTEEEIKVYSNEKIQIQITVLLILKITQNGYFTR